MQSSSVFSNSFTEEKSRLAIALILSLLISCAEKEINGRPGRKVLTGKVTIRGTGPLNRTLFIVDGYGVRTRIEDGRWSGELASLRERMVRVEGPVTGSPRYGYSVEVESYELLPPAGMKAMRGVVKRRGDDLLLKVRDREPGYLIEGRLEGVLGELTGYEMWIWGISGEPGGEYSSITVEGYEMIGKGD